MKIMGHEVPGGWNTLSAEFDLELALTTLRRWCRKYQVPYREKAIVDAMNDLPIERLITDGKSVLDIAVMALKTTTHSTK